jgi:hypothetical protein
MLDKPQIGRVDNITNHNVSNFSAPSWREQVTVNEMMMSSLYQTNTVILLCQLVSNQLKIIGNENYLLFWVKIKYMVSMLFFGVNGISSVMVSMFFLSGVDHWFDPRSGKT